MNQNQPIESRKQVYYRIISLWVICEALAGGIMHAAKFPFTGLIVSSLAITCIILIAWYVPTRSAIIKATVIVAIFKLMLSPHSPPTAYIAVFFQGMMGQLLFSKHRYFKLAAIILAVLALVESAIQRILVLVIVYGNDLWKAVNEFIRKITGEKTFTNYSLLLALSYIFLHAVIGIFVGIYAARLAKMSMQWKNKYPDLMIPKQETVSVIVTKKKKNNKFKLVFIFIWLALLALYIQSYFFPVYAILPPGIIIHILMRSAIIIIGWYLIMAPLTMLLIKRLLRSQQNQRKQEINEVMLLLPATRYIFKESFMLSANQKGMTRIKLFLQILLMNVLAD